MEIFVLMLKLNAIPAVFRRETFICDPAERPSPGSFNDGSEQGDQIRDSAVSFGGMEQQGDNDLGNFFG